MNVEAKYCSETLLNFKALHSVTSPKIELLIVIAVITSNLARDFNTYVTRRLHTEFQILIFMKGKSSMNYLTALELIIIIV
jgi:hypothetical protein